MRGLIAYYTKYGTSEICVKELASQIRGETALLNLGKETKVRFSEYDFVVLGGPVYRSRISYPVLKFAMAHFSELKDSEIGTFLCCSNRKMEEGYYREFPERWRKAARFRGFFGGSIDIKRPNFIDKAAIEFSRRYRIEHQLPLPKIDHLSIRTMADQINAFFERTVL